MVWACDVTRLCDFNLPIQTQQGSNQLHNKAKTDYTEIRVRQRYYVRRHRFVYFMLENKVPIGIGMQGQINLTISVFSLYIY